MSNIIRINTQNKEIILIATAHISNLSAIEVRETILAENPDSICVELDQQRYDSITNPNAFEQQDIIQIIKEKRTTLLLINLVLANQQKKLAKKLDTQSGVEMIEGIQLAKELNKNLVLADRNIQITFKRISNFLSFSEKIKLLSTILGSLFDNQEISEEDLEKLKQSDMLDKAINDIASQFPTVKRVLVDERDRYLAYKIQNAPGDKVVAILGAAHTIGIKKILTEDLDIDGLDLIPEKKPISKLIPSLIPILIIALIGLSFFQSSDLGFKQIYIWILYNGGFAALGCLLVLAHPLTILTAFIAAPFTSLSPLVGVGLFTGIVETWVKKPTAKDFMNISEDCSSLKGIFRNRVTKILIVVLVSSIFSSIATLISSFDIVRNLF